MIRSIRPSCDDVFEVLTSGPFPTGRVHEDRNIEAHLKVCHECRELAEALRPATDMLASNSINCDETQPLPSYTPHLLSASIIENPANSWRGFEWLWLTAAVVVCVFSFWAGFGNDSGPAGDSEMFSQIAPIELESVDCCHESEPIHALRKHSKAQDFVTLAAMSNASTAEQCCSRCHQAGRSTTRQKLDEGGILAVAQSCSLCHFKP